MRTRAELVTEFRRWIDQPHTAIVTAAMANYEINRAYKELVSRIIRRNYRYYYKSGSVTTAAGVAYVAVPSDCVSVEKILDSTGLELPHKELSMFDHSLASSVPTAWDSTGRNIIFQPVPSAVIIYTAWYTYFPSELSTDASIPEFLPGHEDLIAIKAAINSKLIRDEGTNAMLQQAYIDNLTSLLHEVGTPHTCPGRVIASSYGMTE